MGNQVWLYLGVTVSIISAIAFAATLLRSKRTISALIVGLAHLVIVWMFSTGTFRGILDPNISEYSFGFLIANTGPEVTLLSGSLLVSALASALIAGQNRPGKPMLVVTGTSIFWCWNILFRLLAILIHDPSQMQMEFGESLIIPGLVAVPLLLLLFVAPFAYGIRWSWRRAFEEPEYLPMDNSEGSK